MRASRKPLVGEFTYNGRRLFLIANHFNSKGGDDPLMGHAQPPVRSSESQRHQQASLVNGFVKNILAVDANANVVVLGDLNDFQFSDTLTILKDGNVLNDLIDTLPANEQYSYVFEGNSQVVFFEGNYTEYEADRHKRLGTDADRPHRITYRKLTMN